MVNISPRYFFAFSLRKDRGIQPEEDAASAAHEVSARNFFSVGNQEIL